MKINLDSLKFEQVKSLVAVTDEKSKDPTITFGAADGDFIVSSFEIDKDNTGFVIMFNSAFLAMKDNQTEMKTIKRKPHWPKCEDTIESIDWGYDGDCGSVKEIQKIVGDTLCQTPK